MAYRRRNNRSSHIRRTYPLKRPGQQPLPGTSCEVLRPHGNGTVTGYNIYQQYGGNDIHYDTTTREIEI